VVGKFRGRVLLQKGRYHFHIVLKRTRINQALLTVRRQGGRAFCFGVHSAIFDHDPVVYAHWPHFRTAGD
jgi:hypothetical protein